MPRPSLILLAVALIPACDHRPSGPGPAAPTTTDSIAPATTTTASTGNPAGNSQIVRHVRVSIQKVSIGKVPVAAGEGVDTETPRLMIALRIENVSDTKRSEYNSWVPDLDAAKTVARLTDDRGNELKRVTYGFGNNVRGRTVLDTLTPGKVIGDLLVFEAPAANVRTLKLVLPGANCGVPGSFEFDIDAATVFKPK
jgi:hypothetical protein